MRLNLQISITKGRLRKRFWRGFEREECIAGRVGSIGVVGDVWEPGKILLDFDTRKKGEWRFQKVRRGKRSFAVPSPPLASLAHTLGLKIEWVELERTSHGWHMIVKSRQHLTLAETIAAQAILGSDRARERLNLARAISCRLHPSRFWESRANILYARKIQ